MESNFGVFVRSSFEPVATKWGTTSTGIELNDAVPGKRWSFNQVFGPQSTQEDIYEACAEPLVEDFMRGSNATIFAYGQTGSGKTYTMAGNCNPPMAELADRSNLETSFETNAQAYLDAQAGILPRAVASICSQLARRAKDDWILEMTFVEIHNEKFRDLLRSQGSPAQAIKLLEHRVGDSKIVEMHGAASVVIRTVDEALGYIQQAMQRRETAATHMNSQSSRSHSILTLTLTAKQPLVGHNVSVRSKLNLVDLAGSENVRDSGAREQRAVEAGNINQSLLTLGSVIRALVNQEEGRRRPAHIPYRNSKLTQLLSDSLGGPTKTAMIATVNLNSAVSSSCSTLDYASQAKSIKNVPQIELNLVELPQTLAEYADRLVEMQNMLSAQQRHQGVYISAAKYSDLCAQAKAAQTFEMRLKSAHDEKQTLRNSLSERTQTANDQTRQLSEKTSEIAALKAESEAQATEIAALRQKLASLEAEKSLGIQAADVVGLADRLSSDVAKFVEELNSRESKLGEQLGRILQAATDRSLAEWANQLPFLLHDCRQELAGEFQRMVHTVLEAAKRTWDHGFHGLAEAWRSDMAAVTEQMADVRAAAQQVLTIVQQSLSDLARRAETDQRLEEIGSTVSEQYVQMLKMIDEMRTAAISHSTVFNELRTLHSNSARETAAIPQRLESVIEPLKVNSAAEIIVSLNSPPLNLAELEGSMDARRETLCSGIQRRIESVWNGHQTALLRSQQTNTETAVSELVHESHNETTAFESRALQQLASIKELSQPKPVSRGSPLRSRPGSPRSLGTPRRSIAQRAGSPKSPLRRDFARPETRMQNLGENLPDLGPLSRAGSRINGLPAGSRSSTQTSARATNRPAYTHARASSHDSEIRPLMPAQQPRHPTRNPQTVKRPQAAPVPAAQSRRGLFNLKRRGLNDTRN